MYPGEGDLVIGTVQSLFKQGAFIKLDEYEGCTGMLHISEISLKWVRNLRDYVKEGQKVVLMVLKVNESRGHIDLSLRRVNDSKRKLKLQETKQLQRSKKILEMIATELKLSESEVQEKLTPALIENYDSTYLALEAISIDPKVVEKINIPAKWRKVIADIARKSIKPPFVEVTGYLELKSYESDGIEIIKKALTKVAESEIPENTELDVKYISAPMYRVYVKAQDYKRAEKILKKSSEAGINFIKKHKGEGEFHRELTKQ